MKNSTLENNTDNKEQLPGHGSSDIGLPVIKKNEIHDHEQWIVDLHLGKEITGSLLLVISQPLHYQVINEQPGLIANTPITKNELAAIVEKVPKETPLTIVFFDGPNSYRYDVINSIVTKSEKDKNPMQEIKNFKEGTSILELAAFDGKKWLEENDYLIKKWKQEKRPINIHLASKLMYEKDCQSLYETMWKDHGNSQANGEYKKLQDNLNKLASAAVKILYLDLLRNSNAGTKFYLGQLTEPLSTEKLEKMLINSTLCYIIHGLALIVQLAKSTQAVKLLNKERIKKNQKKNDNYAQQLSFGGFTPQLIHLSLKLYADPSQPKLRYKKFFSSKEPAHHFVGSKEKKPETTGINDQVKLIIRFVSKKHSTNINVFFMETPKKELSDTQIPSADGSNQSIPPLTFTPTITGDSNGGSSSRPSSDNHHEVIFVDNDEVEPIELSTNNFGLLYDVAISDLSYSTRVKCISNLECKQTIEGMTNVKLTLAAYKLIREIALSPSSASIRRSCVKIAKEVCQLPNVIEANVRTGVEESKKNLAKPLQASKATGSTILDSKNSNGFFKAHKQLLSSPPKNTRYKHRVFEWRPKAGFKTKEPIKPDTSVGGDFLLNR